MRERCKGGCTAAARRRQRLQRGCAADARWMHGGRVVDTQQTRGEHQHSRGSGARPNAPSGFWRRRRALLGGSRRRPCAASANDADTDCPAGEQLCLLGPKTVNYFLLIFRRRKYRGRCAPAVPAERLTAVLRRRRQWWVLLPASPARFSAGDAGDAGTMRGRCGMGAAGLRRGAAARLCLIRRRRPRLLMRSQLMSHDIKPH